MTVRWLQYFDIFYKGPISESEKKILNTIKSQCIQEINQYCLTYQKVPLFCLSREKVEMKAEKSLP